VLGRRYLAPSFRSGDLPYMRLVLVHHGDAVGPEIDPRRPLSAGGREAVERAAAETAARGVRPAVVWHSGKLRARQTAEAYWRACNALAEFSATRDLQPDDPPWWIRDRLRGETRDTLIAGHFPHLPRLLGLLVTGRDESTSSFPPHGVVALETEDEGKTWRELWRIVR
jgi:phosphohistidine phosphatase